MQGLIDLIISFIIFAVVAAGLYWIIIKFELPRPISLWICGGLLIIVILLYITGQVHVPAFGPKG
jgi:hypothetical protein